MTVTSGRGLTDVAGVAMVTLSVVPPPLEEPKHLSAVLRPAAVVRLVHVPVLVAYGAPCGRPVPLRWRRLRRRRRPDPEVTVTRCCKVNDVQEFVKMFIKFEESGERWSRGTIALSRDLSTRHLDG